MSEKKSLFERLGLLEKIDSKTEKKEEEKYMENLPKEEIQESEGNEHEIIKNTDNIVSNGKSNNSKKIINDVNEGIHLNKPLCTKDIYDKYNINQEDVKTIFIIERFLSALPSNLPNDVKRQSVLNIIAASNMKVDELVNDGNDRVKVLNTFLDGMTKDTNNIINGCREEIERLEDEINEYKEMICKREELQKEQKSMIQYELDRIESITNFVEQ